MTSYATNYHCIVTLVYSGTDYLARCVERPDLVHTGETVEEAVEGLSQLVRNMVRFLLEHGRTPPTEATPEQIQAAKKGSQMPVIDLHTIR